MSWSEKHLFEHLWDESKWSPTLRTWVERWSSVKNKSLDWSLGDDTTWKTPLGWVEAMELHSKHFWDELAWWCYVEFLWDELGWQSAIKNISKMSCWWCDDGPLETPLSWSRATQIHLQHFWASFQPMKLHWKHLLDELKRWRFADSERVDAMEIRWVHTVFVMSDEP